MSPTSPFTVRKQDSTHEHEHVLGDEENTAWGIGVTK